MKKRIVLFAFSILLISGVLSCDFSSRLKDNRKEISFLKNNYRLLTESVSQYERMVKKMKKDLDNLNRRVRNLEKKMKRR